MNTKKLVLLLALAGLSSTQAGFVECFNKHRESITWIPELQTDQLLSNNRFFSMTVDNNIIVTAPLTKMLTTFFTAKENSVKTVASHTFHSFVKTFVSLALLYLAETS
ncbi:hypothetical protein FJ366_04265, partial [Candidatus Dependentiae bacterium]|nr:hypothetical protein [Candidatus Dependentiae bacterium]